MVEPNAAPNINPLNSQKRTCAECGELFETRGGTNGGEELCDYCFEGQFEPSRIRLGERTGGRRHHAR
jgi:formylmethanofuran dehydrogenase subunit E